MDGVWSGVFEPGFFSSGTVQTALLVGGVVAFTSAVVGVFTVMRSQSFAGHALSDVGTTGGSAAFFVNVNPLWGFVGAALVGAGVMEAAGTGRARSRDLSTGVVLGLALGLAALFLYLDTTRSSTTGATVTVLFGSLFVISTSVVPAVVALSAVVLVVVVLFYRMLLLATLDPDLAAARGVRARLVGVIYLLLLAVAVSLSALTIGTVLSTALLLGPPATAVRLAKRPGWAALLAGAIGVVATWAGIVLAYDSYYWPPAGRGWPVSFLIVALVFTSYVLASLVTGGRRRSLRGGRRQAGRGPSVARRAPLARWAPKG